MVSLPTYLAENERLIMVIVITYVCGETINCSLIKKAFRNVL